MGIVFPKDYGIGDQFENRRMLLCILYSGEIQIYVFL